MRTADCLSLLGSVLESAYCTAPEKTFLFREGQAVLVMAAAYESDGRGFLSSGDPVNALASAYYGFGWLHFGICSGILGSSIPAGCPFDSPAESLPLGYGEQLKEKTDRYFRLLTTATGSVRPAPEAGTVPRGLADAVLVIASSYARAGGMYRLSGALEEALASCSYGHGWLDAGTTAGLFLIADHRQLFTI